MRRAWKSSAASFFLAIGVAADARPQEADKGIADPQPVHPQAAATASTAPEPTIAKPAPGAPPAKVEAVKAQAKKAELTPILPSPKDPTRPAFQLYVEIDLPVLAVGLVLAGARLIKVQPAYCAPVCNPGDLNALDRTTAGWWSPAWSTASDVGLYGLMAAAAAVLAIDEGVVPALNDVVVVAEAGLSAAAASTLLSLAAGRPRPFAFGTAAPLASRTSGDAGLSFLSTHTSVAFAVVTSTFMATRRLHRRALVPLLVALVGGSVATFVGTARVMAGQHFITDVVGGAVVGISLGVLIPALHASPVKVVPVVSETQRGLALAGVF